MKTDVVNQTSQEGVRVKIQRFGRFLSGMVMPNIGAFIAWGLITALFIPTGWVPNEKLSSLVGPMILYLLPLLIGYTGGKLVSGIRGGVIGAVATMGVVVGVDIPMFIGAMIMGPLGGYVIKKFDKAIEGKIPEGFEMLINNFSAGIMGMVLAILAYLGIGPLVLGLNNALKAGVEVIVNAGLLPLASLFIEPGKILFLNNAINHGVLSPLGLQEAKEIGKSIFFLLETNPGPGLGILLAYWVFSKGMSKQSAPGAIIIHFLGGIHEIYFPYVLMKPILVLAVIAGGASGVFTFSILGAGLVATPSPGSIFALLAMTPKGGFIPVILGVIVSATVSFLVASFFIKRSGTEEDLDKAKERVKELKNKKEDKKVEIKKADNVNKIVFACDAGMGSSAMGASRLRNRINKNGLDIEVVNSSIEEIPSDADIVISHKSLTERAKVVAPNAEHISIDDFINSPVYDELISKLKRNKGGETDNTDKKESDNNVLKKENIKLQLESVDKYEAIKIAGQLLVDGGYVSSDYIDDMKEREEKLTTYIGKGIAIPHGTESSKENVNKSGIVVLQFPNGVDFGDGNTAYLVIGIAGKGKEHLQILSNLATVLDDNDIVQKLVKTNNVDTVYEVFTSN
ncbi:PTS mannitol transporter subunit IICBA [Thermohalobacter berrensis]|uniref:Mannitol-specific phosphotransferase enzyme IIA component n=1 Tax=Thermohalobacter berrensis TaxID=99594 RepID=A0A419SXP4_9FIRM|nr:PTS mannitol transporter subunit IICBA [Thermohalobacter berrensis]RKD30030.1 PTS mannitol transporter subunit IICBA [Thermohalobacter berrensis]